MTRQTLAVLRHLVAQPDAHYGYQITQATGQPSGLIYSILNRLLEHGWLTADYEPRQGPDGPVYGRPLRRYYQLTPEGLRMAQAELAKADERKPWPATTS